MITEENGTYKLFCGDTGIITIDGLDTEHNYRLYLQFSDEDGNFIGNQINQDSNYSNSVDFYIPSTVSDNLTVPAGEDLKVYYLGVKKSQIIPSLQTLYAWSYEETIKYTHTDTPTTSSKVYTAANVETEDEITAVTTSDETVTDITISAVVYSRDSENDTVVQTGITLVNEDTIVPGMGQRKPVVVYKKVAEGAS